MKKNLIIFFFYLLHFTITLAQNPVWTLPTNQFQSGFISFLPTGSGSMTGDDYSNEISYGAHNSMCDKNGNLLFFIVDSKIYDKDGYFIDEMSGVNGIVAGSQEIAIVPDPNSDNHHR